MQTIEHPDELFPAFDANNIPVFISTDENYAPYASVLINSIIKNSSKKNNYDIIILETSLDENTKRKLFSFGENFMIRFFNLKHLNPENYCFESERFTYAAFYRLFAPVIFKNYEKILYLDIDIIALQDIAELYNTEIQNNYFGAVLDLILLVPNDVQKIYLDSISLRECTSYFNSGVLLFNLEKLRKENILNTFLEIAAKTTYKFADQDVLNLCCQNKITFIPYKYNYFPHSLTFIKQRLRKLKTNFYDEYLSYTKAKKNIHLIHYISDIKPWNISFIPSKLELYWWKYALSSPFLYEIITKNLYLVFHKYICAYNLSKI